MRGRWGASFLELFFVAALLLLFGITTYTLVSVGGNTYRRVMEKRDDSANSRVALSYMTTQIRQHDRTGGVQIRSLPDGGDCLVLTDYYDGEPYELYVYLYDGVLRESLLPAAEPLEPAYGAEIANIDGFKLTYAGPAEEPERAVRLNVWAGQGSNRRENAVTLRLHADPWQPGETPAAPPATLAVEIIP
ncbi:MAG: DUF4860 domain-containing protein [Oscillospiraceae bacterium]|jgi:hypothetical protein|nr:DUF4860 domain-containing protein [Oscillospiraceae bacterium]